MSRGVVLLRSPDPATQLQALRTMLSLSLGDRPADLLVTGEGRAALSPPPDSEALDCLMVLVRLPLQVALEEGGPGSPAPPVGELLSRPDFIGRLATAPFVQVF